MKVNYKSIIFCLLSILSCLLFACTKQESGVVKFDDSEIKIGSVAGNTSFIVRSNTQWNLYSDVDWLTMNITKGAQGASVILTYQDNPQKKEPRKAMITGITHTGDCKDTLWVVQMPLEPFISLEAKEFPISSDSGEHSIGMLTNLEKEIFHTVTYQDQSGDNWISDVILTDKALTFRTAQNKGAENRSAIISLYGVDEFDRYTEVAVTVVQSLNMDPSAAVEKDFKYAESLTAGQVRENIFVKGTVVLDGKNPNFPDGCHTIQDASGNAIVFYSGLDLGLVAGDKVTLWLLGSDAEDINDGEVPYKQFKSIGNQHIMSIEKGGSPLQPRKLHMNALTDDMIYSLVSLQDVEISIPFGAYVNYNEYYVTGAGGAKFVNLTKNYPTSIRDINGDNLYMLTDFDVPYRRNSMPQGGGSITGIVVSESNSNMGRIGRYQLRHTSESDIELSSARQDGFTDVLVEWDFTMPQDLVLGQKHLKPSLGPETAEIFKNNCDGFYKVWDKSKNGEGQLYFGEEYRGDKPSNAEQTANTIKSAGLYSAYWDTGTYWLISNISTKGITGILSIQFESNSITNTGPRDFVVEWSLDGKTWSGVENGEYEVMGQCNSKNLHADHIPGFKPYDFKLPQELCDKDKIYIRLRCNSMVNVSGKTDIPKTATNRLGHISIKYNKN